MERHSMYIPPSDKLSMISLIGIKNFEITVDPKIYDFTNELDKLSNVLLNFMSGGYDNGFYKAIKFYEANEEKTGCCDKIEHINEPLKFKQANLILDDYKSTIKIARRNLIIAHISYEIFNSIIYNIKHKQTTETILNSYDELLKQTESFRN